MIPPPPRNTRTYTLFPDTTLFRYAAVTAIIALPEHPKVRAWFGARGDGAARRPGRELRSLLLTGFVVEIALAPIALYHFHRSGVYGALATIVAIPLTTRSEEHTSELQSLMRLSYAVFCCKQKDHTTS